MADDSGVEIGGDGSVQWVVRVANARKGSVRSTPEGETGYLQSGIDETPFDKPFTIGVKVPRTNGGALAEALRAAAEDAGRHAGEPGYVVTFPLVIEPDNVNQISVSWQSTPPAPSGKHSDPLGALIDKVKKVVRKVAGTKGAPAKGAAKKTAKKMVLTKAVGKKAPVKKAPAKKAPVKQAPAKKVKKAGKKK